MRLTNKKMTDMYKTMLRIRRFEEKIEELVLLARISGFVHLSIGQEAVAVGVCATLKDADSITSTHRGHGHVIAKGADVKLMMAELFAKRTGYCKGKGGSMHIADFDLGILGANGIVGGGVPIAVGSALAAWYKGTDQVCACFFGDGASNQGTTHEAMNLAAIWKLPVLFVAENNCFGEFTRQADHQRIASVADRAAGYDIPGVVVDGNDVVAVYEAASQGVARAREGKGPTLLECKTYRIKGHFVGDGEGYRKPEEVDAWRTAEKDPILRFEKKLIQTKAATKSEIDKIQASILGEIEDAVRFADESPEPDVSELLKDVYAE